MKNRLSGYLKSSNSSRNTVHKIIVGEIPIEVVQKNIKNLHLSVYPPAGRVRITAPLRMNLETIRLYAIAKVSWIRKHQRRLLNQPREAEREYISGESHYFLGKRYRLKVIEVDAPPEVTLRHEYLEMRIRPNTSMSKRAAILDEWYRQQLKDLLPRYIDQYQEKMGEKVLTWGVKKMRTKWGTCNITARRIWLNLELVKKPLHCIEHVVVHEMVHLKERKHNDRFIQWMDTYLPQWRQYKEELNQYPVSHVQWEY